MSDFDPAVAAHAAGHFAEARDTREARLANMTPGDPELPGHYGTLALTAERRGRRYDALHYGLHALAVEIPLDEPGESAATREAQFPSVHLNVGAVMLREAARLRLAGSDQAGVVQGLASGLLHRAWDGIMQQRGGRPHQHEINAKSRMSNLEAIEGRPDSAFGKAVGAAALGFLSESSRFVDHTSSLGFRGRALSKIKVIGRGAGAAGVAVLSAMPGRHIERARDRLMLKTS